VSIPGYQEVVRGWIDRLKRISDEADMTVVHEELARKVAEAQRRKGAIGD
jgi:hypothetical protein